jgi:hypothetical protein
MGKHATKKTVRTKQPKTKLGLPDLDHSKAAVLDSLRSPESKRGYRHAIDEFPVVLFGAQIVLQQGRRDSFPDCA